MKIVGLKCAVLGGSAVVRVVTDAGIDGYGQTSIFNSGLKPLVLRYEPYLLGQDPTDVERVMLRFRRLGSVKPWGSAVSAIEMALWDIAGKAAGLPVYKLLGGKVRDRVRVYNGGVRFPLGGYEPAHFAEVMERMRAAPEGFTIIKQAVAFHTGGGARLFNQPTHHQPERPALPPMATEVPDFFYGTPRDGAPHPMRGPLTEHGLNHMVACVEAMKEVLGDQVGLALDCGPGWTVPDAIRLAQRLEPLNLMWLEDLLTGNYTPYTNATSYREVTRSTSTPIHTGEQLYLRQNFAPLIEQRAVRVIGPDPSDVGGLAELKWVAEYADLHDVLIAPHGIFDGLLGLAAHVQVAATLPDNYIAFEYPVAQPDWWYEIVTGLPDPIVTNGHIEVWERPGLGVELIPDAAKPYLADEDRTFFD